MDFRDEKKKPFQQPFFNPLHGLQRSPQGKKPHEGLSPY
jgi:hypothetical protein